MPAEIPKNPSLPPQVQEALSRAALAADAVGLAGFQQRGTAQRRAPGRCPWERRTMTTPKARPLFDPAIARTAALDSFVKLDPRYMIRNPVMFVVEVGAALTLYLFVAALLAGRNAPRGSSWPFPCGYGSRCCSPISRRRWRKARQGPGRFAAQVRARRQLRGSWLGRGATRTCRRSPPRSGAGATWCWSRRARSSPATVRSSRALPASTKVRSPGRVPR